MASQKSPICTYPPELLALICAHVYASGIYPTITSLDPTLLSDAHPPAALPSSYPPARWSDSVARQTLANLCLVNRSWLEAAKPWLWRKIEVRLPRSWLSLVEQIAGGDEAEMNHEQTALLIDRAIHKIQTSVQATADSSGDFSDECTALKLHDKVVEQLSGPDGSVPPELLTPFASRDPSPRRLRQKSKSPPRWKLMRSISDAVQNLMEHDNPGIYVSSPELGLAAHYVRHLDFNHFRTIGMRRSVEEGVNNRFVTGGRLESVLKEMPNLLTFGATEYMDSALTLDVLKELFLRGSAFRGRGRPWRGRDLVISDTLDAEEEDHIRWGECKELEAVDFTGCVSAVFVNALTDFVNDYVIDQSDSDGTGSENEGSRERFRLRARDVPRGPFSFPGLRRLGLRGVKSVLSHIITSFVLAFPSLTHLDLSCTRITPDLLAALGTSLTVSLQALALERCNWLTGESIRNFLINAPAAANIRELSLYGDFTYPSPLEEADFQDILTHAPCFTKGNLVYLDISSAPLTRSLLLDTFPPQPRLRTLGLSNIRHLELDAVAQFLKSKAPNVEVVTLVATSPELGSGTGAVSLRQATINLHSQLISPLCTAPYSFSLSSKKTNAESPTRLRVIELAMSLLVSLGSGAGSWRVVKSKGGRGWYVDTASGWIAEDASIDMKGTTLRRDLQHEHPWRAALEKLADANGNVSSATGWHARKMEILHGQGLLGREAGLYGAVSFAYQG